MGGMDVVAKPAPSPRRTKRRGRHPDKALSAAFVRSAPPGRHADGNGLYLFVQPTGTRSWVQRLVIRGRRRELGLGAAALVPLAKAREQALVNRMLARSGGDPLSEKRRVQGVPTFAEAAQRVLEQKRGGWRGRWHAHNWWRSMERYVFPRVGQRPVSEVNTADVLEILTPIWHVKAATAREVRQRIRSVLEWAIALDMRNDNPCDRVLPVLGAQNDIVTHRLALPHKDVAAAIETVRTSKSGQLVVKLAFEFLVLTAARSAEVRLATWDEMDTAGRVWTVPALRMKAKREHRVPLWREGAGGPRRGAGARRRGSARVPDAEREGDLGLDAAQDASVPPDRRRCSRLPLVVPGLGGREDRPSACGHRGGAGACSPEQGGGGLCSVGPVRAPAAADGRLVGVSRASNPSSTLNDLRKTAPRGMEWTLPLR